MIEIEKLGYKQEFRIALDDSSNPFSLLIIKFFKGMSIVQKENILDGTDADIQSVIKNPEKYLIVEFAGKESVIIKKSENSNE